MTEVRAPERPAAARRLLPVAALAALALAAHAPVLANGFAWDDDHVIVRNPDTRDLSALGRVVLSPDETPPYYRPLNRASYLLDHQLFGMDPRGFHAVSLGLHVASVLLLFALASRLFRARGPALLAAGLLALHPIHSESVAFLTARNNVFALVFALASAVLLVDADRTRSRLRAALSGLAFLLGLLSKEPALMVLPFLAAWLLVPAISGRDRRGPLTLLVPHVAALAIYLALRTVSLDGVPTPASSPLLEGLLPRLARNLETVPRHLSLLVFPRDLTPFHDASRIPTASLVLGWAALVAAVGWAAWRRSPAALAGLLWFALNLAPVSHLIPIPSALVAERYLHLPAVGLWLVAADAAWALRSRLPGRVGLAAVAIVALALGARTFARDLDWKDDLSLFRSAVEVDPGSVRARYNLGVARKDQGDLEGARREWEAALRLDPSDAETLAQLGTFAAVQGDLATAERHLRRAIEGRAPVPVAHLNLARILERTGRSREALLHYDAFLRSATSVDAELVVRARERAAVLRRSSGP